MSEPSTTWDKMQLAFDLAKRQGWNATFVPGQVVAMAWLLEKEGKSPEDVARAILRKDWLSFVATFV